jgi:hypothetical protein
MEARCPKHDSYGDQCRRPNNHHGDWQAPGHRFRGSVDKRCVDLPAPVDLRAQPGRDYVALAADLIGLGSIEVPIAGLPASKVSRVRNMARTLLTRYTGRDVIVLRITGCRYGDFLVAALSQQDADGFLDGVRSEDADYLDGVMLAPSRARFAAAHDPITPSWEVQ